MNFVNVHNIEVALCPIFSALLITVFSVLELLTFATKSLWTLSKVTED